MTKIIFILGVSIGSVMLGYLVRRAVFSGDRLHETAAATLSRRMKILSIFILNPIPVIDSFWKLPLDNGAIFLLPILGIISLFIGGGASIGLSRLFRIPPERAASVFTCGMFTNILTFGGLIAFVFYGTSGYALVQLFNMLVSASYYVVGFPVSRRISRGPRPEGDPPAPSPFREQPYLIVPMIAIATGLVLNLLRLPRPSVLDQAADLLVPTLAAILGLSIGVTLRLRRIGAYHREIPLILLVKFIIVPAVMIPLGVAFGLPGVSNGVAFNVLVIVSVMPVAFNALVPPALYGFDLDLANSAWIVSTLALIVILPLLFITLKP